MAVEEKENKEKGVTRRTLLKSMVASGVAFAAVSSGARSMAWADSYGEFKAADLPDEKLRWMYETMLRSRYFDMSFLDKLSTGDKFLYSRYPMVHTVCGQEAVSVGVVAAMEKDDWCYRSHRNTTNNLARGLDMGKMVASCIYKLNGYSEGRGGHSHTASKELKQADHAGLIGMEPLIASGTAYGQKILNARNGTKNITVRFSGDGDYNCPDTLLALNESANFALPIVFIVENNGYQMWVRQDQTMKIRDIADRGKGFGIPGFVVDGQDPLAVYNVAREAIARARAGEGPTLIEAKTYRYFDHMNALGYKPKEGMGARGLGYRPDREVFHWLSKDPVVNFRKALINMKILDEKGADEMVEKAKAEVVKAWEWAMAQPNPKGEDAVKFAYADGPITTEFPRQMAGCPLY
jgi:TPP-dependent pyruvate/acetoin dehydrogenase alpha subunit